MPQSTPLTRVTLRTPRAAAIAGIIFSVLQVLILWLLRISLPADPLEAGVWLRTNADLVVLALNLIPFDGIAFLWFIGVLRDRLGPLEDRFFATVFLGSALLFLGMLFVAAAAIGAIILAAAAVADPNEVIGSATLHFARAFAYNIINVYAIKMAGVFMISTSTVAIYTRFAPSWLAVLGYMLALTLLLGSYYISWSFIVFPARVLLLSLHILIDNFRGASQVGPSQTKTG